MKYLKRNIEHARQRAAAQFPVVFLKRHTSFYLISDL